MKVIVKIARLDQFIIDFEKELLRDVKIDYEDESIDILMNSANEKMLSILKSDCNFGVSENKWIFWDSDKYLKIDFWLELVFECYDGLLKDSKLWDEFFKLSGDDDVDYNGSYLMSVNELLQWLFKRDLLNMYEVK